MKQPEPLKGRPVLFGEVLFDVFPDQAVLGGAPFNVAWHLQGFGCNPFFISRIGDDDPGRDVRDAMKGWGMDMAGLQTDAEHPTGQVKIEMSGTAHSFEILPQQAYDFIDAGEARAALSPVEAALFYHGGLIAREPGSREALTVLRDVLDAPVFVDINLRTPFWERETSLGLMRGARWIKLNDEEIDLLAPGQTPEALRADLEAACLLLTKGEQGADLYCADGVESCAPGTTANFADSVGAGDAFASVMILGLLEGWAPGDTMERAQDFASEVCAHRGATINDRAVYRDYRARWNVERRAA